MPTSKSAEGTPASPDKDFGSGLPLEPEVGSGSTVLAEDQVMPGPPEGQSPGPSQEPAQLDVLGSVRKPAGAAKIQPASCQVDLLAKRKTGSALSK